MSNSEVTPLKQKIVVAILGMTFLALVLSFLMSIVPSVLMFRHGVIERASAQAELLSSTLGAAVDFNDSDAAAESLATLSLVPSVVGAAVYVGSDTPFAAYGVPPARMGSDTLEVETNLSQMIVVAPIPCEQVGSVVVVAVSLEKQWSQLTSQSLISLAVLFVAFAVSCKLTGVISRKLGDPLEKLTGVVREISEGKDYSRRVEYNSNDEIGVLVTEFNNMLSIVEQRDAQLNSHKAALEDKVGERTLELSRNQLQLLKNNRLLLKEIKRRTEAEMIREEVERINRHDLKSGLSLVIGYPELLLNEGELSPRQKKHIKRIRAAGYRMLDMIRNQLDIFKMEKGFYSLSKSSVDVVEVICSLEDEFAPLLDSAGVRLDLQLNGEDVVGDEEFFVSGETLLVRTMLRNLIQNGIEACSSGERVNVTLHDGHGKDISISNPKAVPEEIRRRFFDKYVTHGKENGTGLGTYFAALIAKTHGASIVMHADVAHGTTVSVSFREAAPLDDCGDDASDSHQSERQSDSLS